MSNVIKEYGLDADEVDQLHEQHEAVVRKYLGQWVQYGEYVTLEIDTDAGTCVVVKP